MNFHRTISAILLVLNASAGLCNDLKITAESWKALIAETGMKPIEFGAGAPTEEESHKQFEAWLAKRWIGPELKRIAGTPTESKIKGFLEYAISDQAKVASAGFPPEMVNVAKEILAGPERRGIADYLAAHFMLSTSGNNDAAIKGFRQVVEAPQEPEIPQLIRVLAQARLLSHANDVSKSDENAEQTRYYELLEPFLQSDFDESDARWTVHIFLDNPLQAVRWNREPRHISLFDKSKLPEWARLNLAGATHFKLAWNESGRGWGIPKKNGRENAAKNLAAARKKLTRSWELKPSVPYAATDMMAVVRQEGMKEGETRRTWLDRALAAEIDHRAALSEYLNSSRPYRTGKAGAAEMLAFGKVCAETKRYDSKLPTVFNEALHRLAADTEDWRSLYRNPEIKELMLDTRRKRIAALAGDPKQRDAYSLLSVECWLAEDYAGSVAALDHLKKPNAYHVTDEALGILSYVDAFAPLVLRDAFVRGGELRADFEKGEEEFRAGNYAAAKKLWEPLVEKAGDYPKELIKANVMLANFQEGFAKKEWTRMPIDKWLCWRNVSGRATWQPDTKRLRLTSNWEFGRVLFRGSLGRNFELRGKLTHSRPPTPGGMGFFNGHSPFGTGRTEAFWWTVRVDTYDDNRSLFQFAPKYDAGGPNQSKVDTHDEMAFTYRCENGRVTFSIGGKEVVKRGEMPDDAPSGEGAFGMGVLGHGSSSWAEVWDLEARKLAD